MLGTNNKTREQEQQDELAEILGETFENSVYRDQQINHLLEDDINKQLPYLSNLINKNHGHNQNMGLHYQPKLEVVEDRALRKSHRSNSHSRSRSDADSSEHSDNYIAFHESFGDAPQLGHNISSLSEGDEHKKNQHQNQLRQDPIYHIFLDIGSILKQAQKNYRIEEIKEKYDSFVISQPTYTIGKSCQQNIFAYNTLKNVLITSMHVAYCKISQNYKIGIGTDDGRIAIFERDYSKPVNIFEAFSNDRKIISIKWSSNVDYLIVGSNKRQLKAYSFKQSIIIQDKVIMRMRKQPIQLFFLTAKELQSSINSIQFVSEDNLTLLLLDNADQIWFLQYKKNYISYRPFLSQLPVKFNNVFQIKCLTVKYQKNQQATILAIGSENYVTICLFKPYFEIILAYDKEKRAKIINKDGYAHISFRRNPLGILIAWGKYANLLNISLRSYKQTDNMNELKRKVEVKINNEGGMLLPQATLLAGLVTDTLMYQLSQSGVKIYSCTDFGGNNQLTQFHEPIYFHNFSLFSLPPGISLLQQLSQMKYPSLDILQRLQYYLLPCHNQLFLTSSTSLFGMKIQNFQDFIHNLIQNLNNWKVGLQVLVDCFKGKHRNYDNMTPEIMTKNIREYVAKYISFLEVVIGKNGSIPSNDKQAQKNQMEIKSRQIWNQQSIFIFNIIVQAKMFEYLGDYVLPKLQSIKFAKQENSKKGLGCNLAPFIMLKKIETVTQKGVEALLNCLQRQQISYLLLNLDPQQNQIDLPHQINQLLLNNKLYVELVILNNLFGDFYTPLAVLISKHQMLHNEEDEQNRSELEKLVSWAVLNLLWTINKQKTEIHYKINLQIKSAKSIMSTFLPLFQTNIVPLLLSTKYQQTLFNCIIPTLYSNQCLLILNDISNKMLSKSNRDIMAEIVTNIEINRVSNLSLYWLCVLNLFSRLVIKVEIFMGIRYLTSNSISPETLENILKPIPLQLEKQFSQISKQILIQYFNQIENTQYITLIAVIGKITSQHTKVINKIINNKQEVQQRLLYSYIFENLDQIMGHKDGYDLYKVIYNKMEMFIQIDIEKMIILLMRKYPIGKNITAKIRANKNNSLKKQQEPKFIDFIEKNIDSSTRLRFIQNILTEMQIYFDSETETDHAKEKDSELYMRIRLIYIELLAINGRSNEILQILKGENYPIDETLEICRQYGVSDAQAYLLVKSGGQGDIPTAIKLYFKLVADKFIAIKYAEYDQQKFKDFEDYFQSITNECISICGEYLDQWFLIAEKLTQFKTGSYRQLQAYLCDILGDFIDNTIYPKLSKNMIQRVSLPSLVSYFSKGDHFISIDLSLLRIIIKEMLKNIAYQRQMYLLTQESFLTFEQDLRKSLMIQSYEGFSSQGVCEVCGINDNTLLVFYNRCHHTIHPACSQDVKICFKCSKETWKLLEKSLDTMAKARVQLYSVQPQVFNGKENYNNQQISRNFHERQQQIFERLKQFDRQTVSFSYDL